MEREITKGRKVYNLDLKHLARSFLLLLITILFEPFFIGIAIAGPSADYGDAPDPGFPSLYDTTSSRVQGRRGPFHLDTSLEWIGWSSASTTNTETDAQISNNDTDDGNPPPFQMAMICFWGLSFPIDAATAIVPVSIASNAPNTIRYLNVLIDKNSDNQWLDGPSSVTQEWVAHNVPVDVEPGRRVLVYTPPFPIDRRIIWPVWVRFTLTREPIDEEALANIGGWDGSGPPDGFAGGETEDWFITFALLSYKWPVVSIFAPIPRPVIFGGPFPPHTFTFAIPGMGLPIPPISVFVNNWGTLPLSVRKITFHTTVGPRNNLFSFLPPATIAPVTTKLPLPVEDVDWTILPLFVGPQTIYARWGPPLPAIAPAAFGVVSFSPVWKFTPQQLGYPPPYFCTYKVIVTADPEDIDIQTSIEIKVAQEIGYNIYWLIITAVSLMLVGGYLILRRRKKIGLRQQ